LIREKDDVLEEIDGVGTYQKTRFLILSCLPMTMCWHLLGNSLLAAAPSHTCEYNQISENNEKWEEKIPDFVSA